MPPPRPRSQRPTSNRLPDLAATQAGRPPLRSFPQDWSGYEPTHPSLRPPMLYGRPPLEPDHPALRGFGSMPDFGYQPSDMGEVMGLDAAVSAPGSLRPQGPLPNWPFPTPPERFSAEELQSLLREVPPEFQRGIQAEINRRMSLLGGDLLQNQPVRGLGAPKAPMPNVTGEMSDGMPSWFPRSVPAMSRSEMGPSMLGAQQSLRPPIAAASVPPMFEPAQPSIVGPNLTPPPAPPPGVVPFAGGDVFPLVRRANIPRPPVNDLGGGAQMGLPPSRGGLPPPPRMLGDGAVPLPPRMPRPDAAMMPRGPMGIEPEPTTIPIGAAYAGPVIPPRQLGDGAVPLPPRGAKTNVALGPVAEPLPGSSGSPFRDHLGYLRGETIEPRASRFGSNFVRGAGASLLGGALGMGAGYLLGRAVGTPGGDEKIAEARRRNYDAGRALAQSDPMLALLRTGLREPYDGGEGPTDFFSQGVDDYRSEQLLKTPGAQKDAQRRLQAMSPEASGQNVLDPQAVAAEIGARVPRNAEIVSQKPDPALTPAVVEMLAKYRLDGTLPRTTFTPAAPKPAPKPAPKKIAPPTPEEFDAFMAAVKSMRPMGPPEPQADPRQRLMDSLRGPRMVDPTSGWEQTGPRGRGRALL